MGQSWGSEGETSPRRSVETVKNKKNSKRKQRMSTTNQSKSFEDYEFNPNASDPTPDELIEVAVLVFEASGCLKACHVPMDVLRKFITAVKNKHRANQYHNWLHGFHVLLNTYKILARSASLFPPVDTFALLIAAMCHDLDHCGMSNKHLKDINSELWERYDRSPLENHSIDETLALLSDPETDVLCGLKKAETKMVHQTLRELILATDIADPQCVSHTRTEWEKFSVKYRPHDADYRRMVARMLLLCADIGVVCEPYPLFLSWVRRLFKEITLVDTNLSPNVFYDNQLRFLNGYAKTLYSSVVKVNLLDGFDSCIERLENNSLRWGETEGREKIYVWLKQDSNDIHEVLATVASSVGARTLTHQAAIHHPGALNHLTQLESHTRSHSAVGSGLLEKMFEGGKEEDKEDQKVDGKSEHLDRLDSYHSGSSSTPAAASTAASASSPVPSTISTSASVSSFSSSTEHLTMSSSLQSLHISPTPSPNDADPNPEPDSPAHSIPSLGDSPSSTPKESSSPDESQPNP